MNKTKKPMIRLYDDTVIRFFTYQHIICLLLITLSPYHLITRLYPKGSSGLPAEYILSFYPDARTSAIAGAATSQGGSISAIYYNPAGLASNFYNELSFFYTPLFYGTKFTYIGYAYPLAQKETIAASIGVLSTVDIEKTNSIGETLYDFSSQESVFNLAYSVQMGETTDGGINIKFLSQSIDDYSAHTASCDLGLFSAKDDTSYGVVVKNVIPMKLGADKLPLSLRLGLTQRIYDKLFLSGDVAFEDILKKTVHKWFFGSEYNYKIYFLRAGINYKEMTCGVGIAEEKFSLDYAVSFHPLDITHRFSAVLRFGVEPTEAEKYAVKILEENKLKIEEEEKRISRKKAELEKDISVFNVEKEKIEKLMTSDAKLKEEWKKIQQEKQQITHELESVRKKQETSAILLKAQEYYDKKLYKEAEEEANKIIKEDSKNENALILLRKIIAATSTTAAKERYIKAIELYEQGKYTDAIFKADEALKIEPEYQQAQVLIRKSKAQNYIAEKRFQDAKYELVEAIKISPDDAELLELLKRIQTTLDVMEGK
ncbi:MAG: PorV/PorQ family protein [Elusimicrobia bacterium]|nr:PorV/PorQ family protein [Elusimicrobiota bacterium]